MADYKNYLAVNILTEDKLVTYRLLSRALKVHVNTAKEMLYDFHRQQNAKKPGTLHATYLISGTKREEEIIPANADVKMEGGDDHMQSSPFMPSSMPQIQEGTGATSVLSITLVREEDLEAIKEQYEHISSIHIYSLGPSMLKDLQMLSDVTRQIQVLTSTDDPLKTSSTYGTIINPHVKRRTSRRPPPPAAPAPTASIKTQSSKPPVKEPPKLSKQDSKTSQTSQPSSAKDFFGKGKEKSKPAAAAGNTSAPSSKESTPAPPPALKRDSSSIFKAFAKTKAPKEKKEPVEDEVMGDVVSDDDDEEETYVPPVQEQKESGADRKSRKEREEALKRMMEDDDDEEDSAPASKVATPAVVDDEDEDEEMEEAPSQPPKSEEPEPHFTVSGGRRRGKRRVMKKKTVKDEEGYLVTKEEAVWESFSEDEPAPKQKSKPVAAASTASKGKKPAAKVGQGNIMSFFGKK